MKTKEKTISMRRARQQKSSRHQYLEGYLPKDEFALLTKLKNFG